MDNKPYKILVIEDNEGDFVIVELLLKEKIANPVIVHSPNFKKASAILSTPGMVFDIILLDLTLPDESGQQLITEILRKASSCPIIILSGFSNIDFSIQSISQGISDYLVKDDLTAIMLYKSIIYSVERKKSTAQLEQSEKRYSDLFHLSPEPMWVYEMETLRFMQVNKAAIEHYGYSEEEFLGMTILDIRPEEEILRTITIVNTQQHQENGIYKAKFTHRKKTGEIIDVEICSTSITINEKKCKSVIAIDVTEKNLFELNLTKAVIKTQEEERYEIGGELHDNVCQILATCQLSLGMLKDQLTPTGMHWFTQCTEYILLASAEIRNLSHRLAPAFFDDTTLEEALVRLLDSFNMENKYQILFYFDHSVRKSLINRELQLSLYRILQEQLRNILKYAQAALIKVELIIINDKLKMMVTDDGVGFDMDTVKGGIGLANMKRRAALFFGKLEVNSSPGNGCRLVINIPLRQNPLIEQVPD